MSVNVSGINIHYRDAERVPVLVEVVLDKPEVPPHVRLSVGAVIFFLQADDVETIEALGRDLIVAGARLLEHVDEPKPAETVGA